MAFNKNAFAASFLNQLTAGIEEREEEAKQYEEEQRAAAARNAPLVNARKLKAQEAAQIGQKAMQLGAREEHVKAAMDPPPRGVLSLIGQKSDEGWHSADDCGMSIFCYCLALLFLCFRYIA